MEPTKTYLVATDFSTPSRYAVERAAQLAEADQARCVVINAIALDTLDSLAALLGDGIAATKQKLEQEARVKMTQMVSQCRGDRALDISGEVLSGSPLTCIPAQAEALNADLLVLGSRGESRLQHTLLGSTASRLLRRSLKLPVLVVKQAPQRAYQRIMIATDLSPATIGSIQSARRIAPKAEIVLLHLLDLPFASKLSYADVEEKDIQFYIQIEREKCLAQLHALAEFAGLTAADYYTVVVHGHSPALIVEQEQEQHCDLIVIGKHCTLLAEELLLGNTIRHVLAESLVDVMVTSGNT